MPDPSTLILVGLALTVLVTLPLAFLALLIGGVAASEHRYAEQTGKDEIDEPRARDGRRSFPADPHWDDV